MDLTLNMEIDYYESRGRPCLGLFFNAVIFRSHVNYLAILRKQKQNKVDFQRFRDNLSQKTTSVLTGTQDNYGELESEFLVHLTTPDFTRQDHSHYCRGGF